MIVKWIRCTVPPESRGAYSGAQASWEQIRSAPGLVGQVGGWDARRPGRVCILGIWRDPAAYRLFMESMHDEVFAASGQVGSYEECDTRLYSSLFEMPGAVKGFAVALRTASVVRVATCVLEPDREDHFVKVQKELWSPRMSQAKGMMGGLFSKHESSETPEYIVTTAWRDMACHQEYGDRQLPSLRTDSGVGDDVRDLDGALMELESSWSVWPAAEPPDRPTRPAASGGAAGEPPAC